MNRITLASVDKPAIPALRMPKEGLSISLLVEYTALSVMTEIFVPL